MRATASLPNAVSRIIFLQSGDIFRNLAFETCLYLDFARFSRTNNSFPPTDLLMWRSNPCVVIGRFQTPWKECNTQLLRDRQWNLARRQSGGGAVFHDRNNLNISFLEARSVFDRTKCMNFLKETIQRIKPTKCVRVGDRYDLWISEQPCKSDISAWKKISGSSSRLGDKVAYHHCTLLCNSDLKCLSEVLHPSFKTLETKATSSVHSPVTNLELDVEQVQSVLVDSAREWLSERKRISKSAISIFQVPSGDETKFVDPVLFQRILNEFQSWSWIWGSSPAFHVDLSEFYTSQYPTEQLLLHCKRGCLVESLRLLPDAPVTAYFRAFIHQLSDVLADTEFRRFSWCGLLDLFCAKWELEHSDQSWSEEQESVINALRILSDKI